MEEVDSMIIGGLRDMGLEIQVGLSEIDTVMLVAAVSRLIKTINTDSSLSTSLPPGMSARFKAGTKLAEACRDMGYPGEVGYQTFLYPSEREIRSLLIFLLDKLPRREAGIEYPEDLSPIHSLRKDAANASKDDNMDQPLSECDEFCSCQLCFPEFSLESAIQLLPKETRNSAMEIFNKRKVLSSAVEKMAEIKSGQKTVTTKFSDLPEFLGAVSQEDLSVANIEEDTVKILVEDGQYVSTKSEPASKQSNKSGYENLSEGVSSEVFKSGAEAETKDEKMKRLREELLNAESDADIRRSEYKDLRTILLESRSSIKELKARESSLIEEVLNSEKEKKKMENIFQLLPDAAVNYEKLKGLVQKAKNKNDNMENSWEEAKRELEKEYKTLERSVERANKQTTYKVTEKSASEKLSELTELMKQKQKQLNRNKKLVLKIDSKLNRLTYTDRILDILRNVEKQQKDIDNILGDIRIVQKDINLLTGKLDRTFFDLNISIKDLNLKEGGMKEKIKALVSKIHKECFETVEIVRETGREKRNIREIQEMNRAVSVENYKDKVARLEKDLSSLLEENKENKQRFKTLKATMNGKTVNA